MLTRKLRLVAGGSFAALALTAAAILAAPANLQAAEEGRNEGIAAQEEAKAAAASGVLYAVVSASGGLSRGEGAVNVSRGKYVGDYIVKFNANVRKCAYSATIGLPGTSGTSAPGFLTVVGANNNANSVYVSAYNLNAVSSQRGFHLIVACPN